jgi:hypothetical protein
MWSGDIPTGGCKAFDSFDLPTGLISELSCEHGDLYDYKILVADPQNGGKLWEHTYATDVRLDGDSWYDYTSSLIAANADGVVLDVGSGRPGFDRDLYISPAAQTVVALPPATEAQPSPGPGNTFVVKHYWKQRSVGEVLTVIGPDGHERCTLAPMKASWSNLPDRTESEAGSVSLQDGFVLADSDHHQLRMFSNTTCQPMAQVPFDAIYGLIPAPGVLLAIRQDFPEAPNTAVIEGYAS